MMMVGRETGSTVDAWETVPSMELGEAPREQLHQFRDDMHTAKENGIRTIHADSFNRHIDQSKSVNAQMAAKIEQNLAHGGRHLYLSQNYSWLGQDNLDGFNVLRTSGAETSAHGVFFGLLTDKQGGAVLPVAIKPCVEKPATAYADWLNNSLIAQSGQRHFKPVGLMIGQYANYSITEIEQGVETLDNSEWNMVLLDETNPAYEGQRDLLTQIGGKLAEMHTGKVFHGDTQFKNIAVDVAGRLFFIDWESSSFYGDEGSQDVMAKKAFHDLRMLFRSAACSEADKGVGLLHQFDSFTQWSYFKDYIFNPYMERYLELNNSDAAFERVAQVEESLTDYVFSRGLQASVSRIRKSS